MRNRSGSESRSIDLESEGARASAPRRDDGGVVVAAFDDGRSHPHSFIFLFLISSLFPVVFFPRPIFRRNAADVVIVDGEQPGHGYSSCDRDGASAGAYIQPPWSLPASHAVTVTSILRRDRRAQQDSLGRRSS